MVEVISHFMVFTPNFPDGAKIKVTPNLQEIEVANLKDTGKSTQPKRHM